MALHPILAEKLASALKPTAPFGLTRRDARLPEIPGKVHAVIGMRRAGKTTFLRQLQSEVRQAAPPEQAIYLSLDDERLAGIGADQFGFLLEEYFRRFPEYRGRTPVHWYLDEIQLVPGWERFLRRVLDTERISLVVSGSSSRLLSREVHTSLRGRGVATVIRPFSFREFLRHRAEEPTSVPSAWDPEERSRIERRFREYMIEGGFPETQNLRSPLRIELLQGYVDSVLFRDVVERYSVTQVAALRWIVRQLLRSPAGAFSAHRIHKDLRSQGHAVAKDSVHELLDHLMDSFLVGAVPLATDSERKRNSNPRKYFPIDSGLIGAFDVSGRANIGHMLETVVLNELDRRRAEVGYVKLEGGLEVDFLARVRGGDPELIQVCADPTGPGTIGRELRALELAKQDHPRARRRLLVLDRDAAVAAGTGRVEVQPVYEWLLDS